ncbi:hypothetical protein R3P38DRAFT_2860228 [Favolaschia claudopus]|uniref:Uncharacterized protein n=1 Tax=Favolaschia claudopus TaxID=2862362 RepID=A0AAW0DPM2_9AGAR
MHPRRHRNSDSLGSTSRFSQPLNIPSPSPRSTGSQLKSAHSTAGPSSRPEGRPSHVRDSSLARCFPSTSSTSTRRLHPIHPPPTNSQTDHTATSTPLAFTSTARSAAPQPPTNTSSKSSSFFSPSNSSAKARGQCLPLDTSAPVRYLPGYRPLTTDEEIKLRRFMVDALIAKSKKYRSQISIPNLSTDAQSTLLTNLSLRKSAELRGDSLINFRMVRFVGRLLPHVPLPIRKASTPLFSYTNSTYSPHLLDHSAGYVFEQSFSFSLVLRQVPQVCRLLQGYSRCI